MKILKNQAVALLLCLILISGATWYGANRSLGARIYTVNEMFYEGVSYHPELGRPMPSIHGQLSQRATAALRVLSIGEHRAGLEQSREVLETARRNLARLLDGGSPGELFLADLELSFAFADYIAVLRPMLQAENAPDLETLDAAYDTMRNAARVIRDSGYNEVVLAFYDEVLGRFPTNILINIVSHNPPERFA